MAVGLAIGIPAGGDSNVMPGRRHSLGDLPDYPWTPPPIRPIALATKRSFIGRLIRRSKAKTAQATLDPAGRGPRAFDKGSLHLKKMLASALSSHDPRIDGRRI